MQPFWVPLHRQTVTEAGNLESFDDAVWSVGGRFQVIGQKADALVVLAIDLDFRVSKNF